MKRAARLLMALLAGACSAGAVAQGAPVTQGSHGPLYFAAGVTDVALPPAGKTPVAQVAGNYGSKIVLSAGACTWNAETTFVAE